MKAATLFIKLFGALDLRYGEHALPAIESARAESLLAYLLMHREAPQPRQRIAFVLWPDSTEQQARTNLRHVLHTLRRTLPECDTFLNIQQRTLQWRRDAPFWLDVAVFEDAIAAADSSGDPARLREAVEIYAEDVLPTCYDEWLLEERERLRQRYLSALERLVEWLRMRGEHRQAIVYAERLLRHDPLQEETYRLLMRLYDACGDRARALRTYHACARTLERELGVRPSASTSEMYEALVPIEREPLIAESQGIRVESVPLVGRSAERIRLTALWRATERGTCHLVLITGEPGIGKTRLVEEFRSWCAHRGALTAEARLYAAEGALAYGPVVSWLRSEPIRSRVKRLSPAHLGELARLLPEVQDDGTPHPSAEPMSEREQRQRLFDALARAILAAGTPLLLVVDDLQWCDRETLQFLHYLLRYEPAGGVLVAATARRGDLDLRHPLRELIAGLQVLERFTEIPLERLSREETAVVARHLVRVPIEEPDLDHLYHETEGNPLFVVEALRAGWHPGRHGRVPLSARGQAVITTRLDQLSSSARTLVGMAATIGRAFSSELLAQASDADADRIVRSLDELWRRDIIREQGSAAYDFSHDKIREAAYLSLSPALRRHHHLRVAQALERLHAGDPAPVSAQIAGHYEQAGRGDVAISWYERAAAAAQEVYAGGEAARLLERALHLLHAQPETPQRHQRELANLTTLLPLLVGLEGYHSNRLTHVQQRALDLTHSLSVEPTAPLLRSLALDNLSRGDFDRAQAFGKQLQERGEREADAVLLVEGEYVLGIAAFWQGRLETAREHFESSIRHYRPEHRHAHLLYYGQDPKVICLGRLGLALWLLGYVTSAVQARDAALALADAIAHPITRGVALVFSAVLALERGDFEALRKDIATAATVSEGRAIPVHIPLGAFQGLLDVLAGRTETGITRIQRTLEDTGGAQAAPGMQAFLLRLLLAACAMAGDARSGLAVAERALAFPGGARVWEAEVYRLRAEFLAALDGAVNDVEGEFKQALQVARRQGAQTLALRAATSLVRYRTARGDTTGAGEALALLKTIVDTFPEKGDTPDLRAALALLTPR